MFVNQKKFEEFYFSKKVEKQTQHSDFVCSSQCGGSTHSKQGKGHLWAASWHHAQHLSIKLPYFELCLWASMLCLHLFCASLSKICPKETPSSLYTISAYSFHKDNLFSGRQGILVLCRNETKVTCSGMCKTLECALLPSSRQGGRIVEKALVHVLTHSRHKHYCTTTTCRALFWAQGNNNR